MHTMSVTAGLFLFVSLVANAAEQRAAKVAWGGVAAFSQARVTNALDAAVRQRGTSGGVAMPGIFLHPLNADRAVADYGRVRLAWELGQRLFFLAYAGISEGFNWQDEKNPPDGARFYVTVNGTDIISTHVRGPGWVPLLAEVPVAAGLASEQQTVTVALSTDCGPAGNSNYDWALFGEPLIVAVDGGPLPEAEGVPGTSGVLIARTGGEAGRLIVEGLDAVGEPVAGAVAVADVAEGAGGGFVRFDFSDWEACAQWRWRAEGLTVAQAVGGSWQPSLRLEHVGFARTVLFAAEPLQARVAVRNLGPGAVLEQDAVEVECNGRRQRLGRLSANEMALLNFDLGPARDPDLTLTAILRAGQAEHAMQATSPLRLWPGLPALPARRPNAAEVQQMGEHYLLVQNPICRWVLCKSAPGLGALVYVWTDAGWELAGTVAPFAEVVLEPSVSVLPDFSDIQARQADGNVTLEATGRVNDTTTCQLLMALEMDAPALRVELTLLSRRHLSLFALRGPAVHAGERCTGTSKGIALFPGLEYLEGEERSSSARDLAPPLNERWTPHKFKITVPLMLVETRDDGPVLGLAWDPRQRWDGEHMAPSASFASPDFLAHKDSHLMQLALPSTPDFIPENHRLPQEPLKLQPNQPWRLVQYILAGVPSPDATAALEWFDRFVGYPQPEAPPRSFEEEIALCRHGFMVTCWDETTRKNRHVVGWGPANSPGFATLLLMDAYSVAQGDEQQRVLERVNLIGNQTVAEQGPAGLASGANCHVMGWEFPFHWGHLPGALEGMRAEAYSVLGSQSANGGWGYNPPPNHLDLGAPGTQVLGTCARNAYVLARYAAISGDPAVTKGLRRALERMRQFRVPRGAQGWECPILQPDVLASAYAVRAFVWAHMATGEPQWLDDAAFWARTGLPFQYAWDDGERPGMRYASIPVFGSTFFTHSWIGLPVQWCGLVYAYGLQELMRYEPNDLWRRQAEGITVSAMHQQWPMDNPDLAGTYPDSYGAWFTRRNPVFINPESIQLNLLALHGRDPGLRSTTAQLDDQQIHVTAPCDLRVDAAGGQLQIAVSYFPNQVAYLTVAPVALGPQTSVRSGGVALERDDVLAPGAVGWAYNEQTRILVVSVRTNPQGSGLVILNGLTVSPPEGPKVMEAWEFESGTEDWGEGNHVQVSWNNGILHITTTGFDPYVYSGPARIDADAHKRLAARVRLVGGEAVGLFWRSSVAPSWSSASNLTIPAPADGEWHEVEFDLSDHPNWTGVVHQIRLDVEPAETPPGAVLEVDWIRPR